MKRRQPLPGFVLWSPIPFPTTITVALGAPLLSVYCYILIIITTQRRRKTSEAFFIKICTSHFICNVWKGLLMVCVWEGAGDRTEIAIFWPHSYGRQRCVFLVLLMLNWRPWAHSAGLWLSLLHLISNFSGPQLNRGPQAPSAWCGFHYHISSITPSDL